MILALGARGPEFDSPLSPVLFAFFAKENPNGVPQPSTHDFNPHKQQTNHKQTKPRMMNWLQSSFSSKKKRQLQSSLGNGSNRNSSSRRIYCTQSSGDHVEHLREQSVKFSDNTIHNTKYSIWTFAPKSLYEQFSLHMNQYFLLLALMQLWRTITPVNPISTWTPLIVVVGVGMIKELVDDLFRWRKDREANEKRVLVLREGCGRRVEEKSKNVRVGDLVLVSEDETVCADMVVLRSSDMEHGGTGTCFIETSALDGEEDYKERSVPKKIQERFMHEIHSFNGVIECPLPNAEIDKFDSTLTLSDDARDQTVISLSQKNLLLQGTVLKSTEWVIGMVVYTGNESKIGMNKQEVKIKWTRMDTFINNAVVFIFLIQFICGCILGTTGNIVRSKVEHVSVYFYDFCSYLMYYRHR